MIAARWKTPIDSIVHFVAEIEEQVSSPKAKSVVATWMGAWATRLVSSSAR